MTRDTSPLVDLRRAPPRGGQNRGNSLIESGEIPLILVIPVEDLGGQSGDKSPTIRKPRRKAESFLAKAAA